MDKTSIDQEYTRSLIQSGMVFTAPADFGTDMQGDWVVVGPGTWKVQDGEAKWLLNPRNNKWWCTKVNSDQTIHLMCFDDVLFDRWKDFNFRHPDKGYDTSKPF